MATKVAGRKSQAVKPDPEKVKDRQINWRLGWIAAAAAVAASLISGVVGVYIGANRDDERSRQEVLRTERSALYTDYVAAIDESRLLMQPFFPPGLLDIGGAAASLQTYSAPESRQKLADIEQANGRVMTIGSEIAVVGGDVALLAEKLEQDLVESHRLIQSVYDCEASTPGSWICDAYLDYPSLGRSLDEFLSDRDKLLAAARAQLDID
jgi:hypothetical protein